MTTIDLPRGVRYRSVDDMAAVRAGITKWDRTLEAIGRADGLTAEVAHSVGDSLTYWRTTTGALTGDQLTGHRRYHTVLVSLRGTVGIELSDQNALTAVSSYSDLSDRQTFTGTGTHHRLDEGELMIVPIDWAWRVQSGDTADILVLRVTVEGATFHNK